MSSINFARSSHPAERLLGLAGSARAPATSESLVKLECRLEYWAHRLANEPSNAVNQKIHCRIKNARRFLMAGEIGAAMFELNLLDAETQAGTSIDQLGQSAKAP